MLLTTAGLGLDLYLDEHVGDLVRRRLQALAAVDDLRDRVMNLQRLFARLLLVVAHDLLGDVDEASRVDGVVRGVEDAAGVEVVPVAGEGELIVRRAGDDACLEARNGLVVHRRAEGARREDVAVDVEDALERYELRPELPVRALGLQRVDVGHRELRPAGMKLLAQVVADMTDALHHDVNARERRPAQLVLDARLDASPHAERGEGRRIPRPAVGRIDAGDPLGHRADDLHVLQPRPAVLRRDVVPAEIVDELAEGAEEGDPVEVLRREHEDALAAAVG